jgi:Low affinity iron permease
MMVSQRASPTSQTNLQERPLFARFARWFERQVGRSLTFVLAIAVVLLWAALGPVSGWSDTWQLVINTGTTIVTFLMVFVIQNTQSRVLGNVAVIETFEPVTFHTYEIIEERWANWMGTSSTGLRPSAMH